MLRALLQVEWLEDRCVPAVTIADPTLAVDSPAQPTDALVDSPTSDPIDDSGFVIDAYLIDPNAPATPVKPADGLIPDSAWSQPDQSVVPPAGDPFWAVSNESMPTDAAANGATDSTTPTDVVANTADTSNPATPTDVAA